MTPDPWCQNRRHGDDKAAYDSGCRCIAARVAVAAYQRGLWADHKAGRRRLVDATGTRRRLCALHAIGWTQARLGEVAGVTEDAVRFWRGRDLVHRSTAETVARIYDQLAGTAGPSRKTRNWAAAQGWLTPAWWVDGIDDPWSQPVNPWVRYLASRLPLLPDRDGLDDAADRALDDALDAIDAADEAWFAARRSAA